MDSRGLEDAAGVRSAGKSGTGTGRGGGTGCRTVPLASTCLLSGLDGVRGNKNVKVRGFPSERGGATRNSGLIIHVHRTELPGSESSSACCVCSGLPVRSLPTPWHLRPARDMLTGVSLPLMCAAESWLARSREARYNLHGYSSRVQFLSTRRLSIPIDGRAKGM